MTTHLHAQFPELNDLPLRAELTGDSLTITQAGEVVGAFYTRDGEGVNRLKAWLRAHRLTLDPSNCHGFEFHPRAPKE